MCDPTLNLSRILLLSHCPFIPPRAQECRHSTDDKSTTFKMKRKKKKKESTSNEFFHRIYIHTNIFPLKLVSFFTYFFRDINGILQGSRIKKKDYTPGKWGIQCALELQGEKFVFFFPPFFTYTFFSPIWIIKRGERIPYIFLSFF